jgi:hypothetical protein
MTRVPRAVQHSRVGPRTRGRANRRQCAFPPRPALLSCHSQQQLHIWRQRYGALILVNVFEMLLRHPRAAFAGMPFGQQEPRPVLAFMSRQDTAGL